MKKTLFTLLLCSVCSSLWSQVQTISPNALGVETFVYTTHQNGFFTLAENGQPVAVQTDANDYAGVHRAVMNLEDDFRRVTGHAPVPAGRTAVIIGTVGKSAAIDGLIKAGKLKHADIVGKREKFIATVVDQPVNGVDQALVIAGSDKRGTIYGIYELSRQIGVSPWYWWADVPDKQSANLYIKPGTYTDGEPKVKYRGIFINDEAPAFQGWCNEKFGGVNSKMYVHMFELILRLKGNFLWPAMWGNMIYVNDPESGRLADEMGIVLGTSHHEPLGRAHEEWAKFHPGRPWDYEKNAAELREFWRGGMERMKDYETLTTVGMRGDGDAAMSEGTNIKLLERIIQDQRRIIREVTGKKPEERPQVWALYKEVQDYYDKGMRVPDDITLLLCDDNWGNVRKLPDINAPKRKGGYGIYYHFDYVGAPRNYKWINVTQNQRTWEQMSLAYRHGVDRLWVVNVGDLKPMEFPISFFLDLAWDPDRFQPSNLLTYTVQWAEQQFGPAYAEEIARMLDLYTKYNSRVTPELLTDRVYSLDNYSEFKTVVDEYKQLAMDALRMYNLLPANYRDAFDELVLFPINGMCNLYEMYYALAMNKKYAAVYDMRANDYARQVKACFQRDSLLTVHYGRDIAGGKWAHQMDQVRIGYSSWNDPNRSIMPTVEYVYRETPKERLYIDKDGYVSIHADHFARSQNSTDIHWQVIPELGRTGSAMTTMPQDRYPKPTDQIYLEYDFLTQASGDVEVSVYLAPTLNWNANKGLRYALSLDGSPEQIVNFNGHYKGELGDWQGYRIIISRTKMKMNKADKHTLRLRVLDPGIVLEQVILNFGGLKPTYLGAPESEMVNTNSPFPKKADASITTRQDHDQMMEQLGIVYPALQPSVAPNKSPYNTARSGFGLWTNYVQTWQPNGDYYTGAKFYKPLKLHDLTGLTAANWPTRRQQMLEEVQQIYGFIPKEASQLRIKWTVSDPIEVTESMSFRNGTFARSPIIPARQYIITGEIDTSMYPEVRQKPVISATLRIPANIPVGQKVPVVINYGFSFGGFGGRGGRGNAGVPADEELWAVMAPAGIATLAFNPTALQPDNGAALTSYLIGLVNKGEWRKPSDWGTLVAWGWGISRLIDFFESGQVDINPARVAVTGHSRYGKGTLVAMAYDTRIASAFPSSSGAMGMAQSRRHLGEDLENVIADSEYHWLAGNAMKYAGVHPSSTDGYLPRKVMDMSVDAETLVALCAPRPLFVGSGQESQGEAWVDPYGLYLTSVIASPIYELLGKKGIIMPDTQVIDGKTIPMPVINKTYIDGDIGYRQHEGGHQAGPNYPAFKDFLLKYWH